MTDPRHVSLSRTGPCAKPAVWCCSHGCGFWKRQTAESECRVVARFTGLGFRRRSAEHCHHTARADACGALGVCADPQAYSRQREPCPKPPDGGGGERALSWVAWETSGVCKMKGRRSVPGPARQLVKPFPTGSSSAILKPQPTRWDAVIEGVGAGCWGSGFPLLEWERTGARGRVDGPVRPELGWDSCLI